MASGRRPFLTFLEIMLFALSAITLGFCAYAWLDSWWYQHRAEEELSSLPPENVPKDWVNVPTPAEGAPLGEISIPHLGFSSVILEGTTDKTLRRAVGHLQSTPRPGQNGNICLAAHRDSFFRPLKDVGTGDEIYVQTPMRTEVYRVISTKIVEPDEVSVLKPTKSNTLTLITCYPFYYIGNAPHRFVVQAQAVSQLKTAARQTETAGVSILP
jgi:sortase A